MKTILKLKSAVFLLLVSFVFTGCLNDLFEQRDNRIAEDTQQLTVFPTGKSTNEPAAGSGATVTSTFNIEKVSREGAAVDAAYTVGGTAVSGTHYTIAQGSPVSMGDGTFVTTVTINVLDSPLASGESATVVINLQDSGIYTAAPNISTFTLTIFGAD